MKKLNDQCTAIFAAFLDQVGQCNSVVLESAIGPDLLIRIHSDHFQTTEGAGKVYMFSQEDPEDCERKMPEMLFIVVDNRYCPTEFDKLIIWPQRYADDRAGVYLESIIIQEDNLCTPIPVFYEATLQVAHTWLLMLGSNGYLR